MENQPSTWKTGISYGLITGLFLNIYSLLLYLFDLQPNTFLGLLSYVILIVGIIWAHRAFKERSNGFMSLSQGLGLGTVVSTFAGLLSSIFLYFYLKFIDTELPQERFQEQMIEMENQGMSDEQVDQAMAMAENLMTPEVMAVGGLLGLIFFGFILSLIISAFTKKTNPEAEI